MKKMTHTLLISLSLLASPLVVQASDHQQHGSDDQKQAQCPMKQAKEELIQQLVAENDPAQRQMLVDQHQQKMADHKEEMKEKEESEKQCDMSTSQEGEQSASNADLHAHH